MPVTLMVVREPVLVTSQICKSWILSQTWIQRIHLMHFCESLISGNSLSQGNSSRRCLNGISMMFRSFARLCRVQLPLLTQVAHLQSCWGKDKLYSLSSGCTNLWAVCMDYHTFFYYVVAGSYQPFHSLEFNNTDTTGCDFVDIFQIAELWNRDIRHFWQHP